MNSDRNLNPVEGGNYNNSTNIAGNNIQGNNIQGDYIQGNQNQIQGDYIQGNQNQTQEIMEIHNLLIKYQKNHSPDEAINMTAKDLATQYKNDSSKRSKLMAMGKHLISNGGIEAVGKVIELAIKLMPVII